MPIRLSPRAQFILYTQSAEIIRDFLISKDSLRNLVYAAHIEEKKQVFALVIQTLKYRNALMYLLSVAQIPGFLHHELLKYALILNDINRELRNISETCSNSSQSASKPTNATPNSKQFITRDDQATLNYEGVLFQTKRSRLLWSLEQSTKQQSKTTQSTSSPQDHSDASSTTSSSDRKKAQDTNPQEQQSDKPTSKPTSKRNDTKSKKGELEDEDGDNENDTDVTGISNAWFSAFVTYIHDPNPTKSAEKSAKKRQLGATYDQHVKNVNPDSIFQYPIECMLVLAYDLLFGSKQLPRATELKAVIGECKVLNAASTKIFRKGILDSLRVLALKNPPPLLTPPQLRSRAHVIQTGGYLQHSYEAEQNKDDTKSAEKGDDKKKEKKADRQLQIRPPTLPILSQGCINDPLFAPMKFTSELTYIGRLEQVLPFALSSIPLQKGWNEQQITQARHPDNLIPVELRGKYKRSIPRYVRINTNKTTHYQLIDKLINEHGYTQLDVIPHMFQLPSPSIQSTPVDPTAQQLNTTQHTTQAEAILNKNIANAAATKSFGEFDQFEMRQPGQLDTHHIATQITPNLRRGTTLFKQLEPKIQKALSTALKTLLQQPPSYKQSTAVERQATQAQAGGKATAAKNFWIDPVLPDILCFSPRDAYIVHCDLVKDGHLVIQDRSSCLPPAILHPKQGSVCIDACSAPGNKTSYLSALMRNTGTIYAIELNQTRAELMRRRMEQYNATNVTVLNTSFFDISPTDPKFKHVEYIMLDPSCSGSGNVHTPQYLDILLSTSDMLSPFSQASPGAPVDKSNKQSTAQQAISGCIQPPPEQLPHVKSLSELQQSLLKHALSFPNLKAFIYSTCSVYELENEHVVRQIAPFAAEKGFNLIPALPLFSGRGLNRCPNSTLQIEPPAQSKGKKDKKIDIKQSIDLNNAVRVDHSVYNSGGFFVALFAKPGVYSDDLLNQLLQTTKAKYPDFFQ